MLKINNLYAEVDGVEILKGLTLEGSMKGIKFLFIPEWVELFNI